MKLLIAGKGGSGKSTLAALLARAFAERGTRVLLVDADESNLGLHRLLGLEAPVALMDHLGGKKGFRQKTASPFPQGPSVPLFAPGTTIDQLPGVCLATDGNLSLLAVGKLHAFGDGCACAMGSLSQMVLGQLAVAADELVIVDTEAGIEHFGRRVDGAGDLILGVVDPSYESVLLAAKMESMAAAAGASFFLVFNRVATRVAAVLEARLPVAKILARIPPCEELFAAGLEGRPPVSPPPEIEHLRARLQDLRVPA